MDEIDVLPKTVAVDFDGVLRRYDGWHGEDHTNEPLPGALDFLRKLPIFGYEPVIYTVRPGHVVRRWLDQHGYDEVIKITNEKPLAMVYIDDRAYRKLARNVVPEHAYKAAYDELESLATSIRSELADLAYVVVPDVSAALRLVAEIDWSDLDKEEWREIVLGFVERIDLEGKAPTAT